ncbi:MAG: LacI family transcriptional regulator [Rhodobacteraceae bacterium]|nr:LacI family transcriptional regulator [Paracoccaceae bacterium]
MCKADKRKKTTMADLARLTGVSVMTVSRALKPNGSTSAETRRRILEAAENLGYLVDRSAVSLATQRSGFVAVVTPRSPEALFQDIRNGLCDGLLAAGVEPLLSPPHDCPAQEETLVVAALSRRPEAIVLAGGPHTPRCSRLLEQANIPVVEIFNLPKQPIGHAIGFCEHNAGRRMARYLTKEGYRRIGFLGGDPSWDPCGGALRGGFLDELRHRGVSDLLVQGWPRPTMEMASAAKATRILLRRDPDIDAIMCVSDKAAYAALQVCEQRGLQAPCDVAIASFGNTELAAHSTPGLTSLDIGACSIGARAADVVVRSLKDGQFAAAPSSEEIQTKLKERGSTHGTPKPCAHTKQLLHAYMMR